MRYDLANLYTTKNLDIEELLTDLHGLFIVFTKRYSTILFSEGLQLCRLATLQAINTYNPKKRVSVLGWIYVVIHHKLVSAIQYETSAQNLWERSHVRLDKVHHDSASVNRHNSKILDSIRDESAPMPYDNLLAEELRPITQSIISSYVRLTSYRKKFKEIKTDILTDYYINCLSPAEMTKKYTAKRQDNHVQKFRLWLQNKIKVDGLLDNIHLTDDKLRDIQIRDIRNRKKMSYISNLTKKKRCKNTWKL